MPPRPIDPSDPQQHAVYDWERSFVETAAPSEVMDAREAASLALSASAWLGIPPPAIRTKRGLTIPCQALPETWEILVADWGRNSTTVLHEVAHLGTMDELRRGEAPHGRAFLGVAIALYAKFLGIPTSTMEASAKARRLDFRIPDRLRTPDPAPPSREGFYSGEW